MIREEDIVGYLVPTGRPDQYKDVCPKCILQEELEEIETDEGKKVLLDFVITKQQLNGNKKQGGKLWVCSRCKEKL